MMYQCTVCGYVYDEEEGEAGSKIEPGTKWDALPENWVCPICGTPKNRFELL